MPVGLMTGARRPAIRRGHPAKIRSAFRRGKTPTELRQAKTQIAFHRVRTRTEFRPDNSKDRATFIPSARRDAGSD